MRVVTTPFSAGLGSPFLRPKRKWETTFSFLLLSRSTPIPLLSLPLLTKRDDQNHSK